MPQHDMNFEGGRKGTCRHTCQANELVNGCLPGTGLVNGAVVHKGSSAAVSKTTRKTPAGTLSGPKPPCMVNGYINHEYRGKRKKAAPPKTLRKEGSTISDVADGSAAATVVPAGISINGATRRETVAPPRNLDQKVPDLSSSASGKDQRRRWKRFRHKQRNTDVAHQENSAQPRQEEDWENEIQELKLTEWEKMCFGIKPYGPDDLLHFALRDLTLQQTDAADQPVTAGYSPAVHHPRPIHWCRYSYPTEPDQFADTNECPNGSFHHILCLDR